MQMIRCNICSNANADSETDADNDVDVNNGTDDNCEGGNKKAVANGQPNIHTPANTPGFLNTEANL